MNILRTFSSKLRHQYRLIQTRRRWINEEKKYLSHISFPELTKEEIAKIKQEWRGIPVTEKYFNEYRFYKKLHGFDARYLAMPIYDPLIIRKLNSFQDACVFVNKGLFDIFFTMLKQPQLYIKRIDNHYFDGQSKLIPSSKAIDILCQYERFIIKPSANSHGGAGIKLIKHRITQPEANALIEGYKCDFIVQEIIKQHPDTAKFNPESLNTIRIISLFLNDKVTILKSALRCGQNGAEVDNATSGGLMIKIKEDGFLEAFGVDARFEKILETHNGIKISGHKIANFDKLEEIVKIYHPRLYPTLHLIAWDFAINEDGDPVFIEGNTKVPGIFWMQLCAGPIFGDLTKEVMKYVLKK
ncbi:Sugar-transfer associated ATP-grasp [Porphyromonadaceae bacterium NLAE-zl-C104]|nr:Sugar-transfer associated ATP-grasp [Porphyromonadaceae bacterium NLAE-zl-C104]